MFDFAQVETDVLTYWKKEKIYPSLKKRNAKGKKFYFLQGPPYTSGYLHLGQAWNNTLKDMVLRYHRMKGEDVWDRGGYDMHGLPTERKVMEELGFTKKEEIVKYGVDKFAKKCLEYSIDKAQVMSKDLWRMGVWMDHENAYMPIKNEYIESIWWLVKQAHEKKRLYEGLRTLSWCPNCATAMAKHECEYKELTEESVFVKFKVKGKNNEYLLVWTTTPWTLAFNMGIMVHPEIEYLRVKVDDEVWIVAKGLAAAFISGLLGKKMQVLEAFMGEKLKGMEYEHFWAHDIPQFQAFKKQAPKTHTVVLSEEYVSLKGGTGLVHMAGGCGPEDYEVSHRNNILPFNNLHEDGTFPKEMGMFTGLRAKKDDAKFIFALKESGVLVAVAPVQHEYAHCQRCHEPVVFRTTKQWFFKTEDLKAKMVEENAGIHWVPITAKHAFDSWLHNLRDNSITKQRFWGTPVPIWRCEKCDIYTVVGSLQELNKLAGKLPENLHKPWIDAVHWKCACGGTMKRVPDILDVWIDAGCASWACLDYPQRTDLFQRYFPSDFIIEGKDQIRGWFNLLMVASMLAFDKNCFRNVYMHGFVTDVSGVKMSKSLGNVISPYELINKYGVDSMRFYMTGTNAGEDSNFSWEELKIKYKNLAIIWNVHKYLIDYANNLDVIPRVPKRLDIEEKYMFSRLHSTMKRVTEAMDTYQIDVVPALLEELFLELSRTYIQLTREKVNEKPELVLGTIYHVLIESLKMLSLLCPFLSEKMYLDLKDAFKLKEKSIHHYFWPMYNEKYIDPALEQNMALVQEIIQATLAAREQASIGVRWPLKKVTVVSTDLAMKKSVTTLSSLLLLHVNIKALDIVSKLKEGNVTITPNKNALGKDFKQDSVTILQHLDDKMLQNLVKKGSLKVGGFALGLQHVFVKEELPKNLVGFAFSKGMVYIDTLTSPVLEGEGFAREVMRRIQQMRKDAGMVKKDRVVISITGDYDLHIWKKDILEKVGAKTLVFEKKPYGISEEFSVKGKTFAVSLEKVA